ncbi:MAG: DCC1-like thiol-disulfide oxidoreductase family protein [Pseudomonadota bacterium]
MAYEAFSFRSDPDVPAFDDTRGLIVFDGVCIFCSGFVQFVAKRDTKARFLFTTAQSPLGQALYRHYRLDPADLETNLVIVDGRLHAKLASVVAVARELGWPWRGLAALRALPAPIADWCYDRIARNRYRIFGKHDQCVAPQSLRDRLVS